MYCTVQGDALAKMCAEARQMRQHTAYSCDIERGKTHGCLREREITRVRKDTMYIVS